MSGFTDIRLSGWVAHMPPALRPYILLARLDRPIGVWLLFLPGLWAICLGARGVWQGLWLALLFALGAVVMRGAGCVVNDLWDRDLDAKVERTRGRPLASGAVSVTQALLFLALLCLTGLAILLLLDRAAEILGVASLLLVALYPAAKRVTWWPQVMLGQRWTVRTRQGDVTAYTGPRAPHLLSDEDRKKQVEPKDMVLDIGARDEKEALAMGVRPGDPAAPYGAFVDLGNGRLLGKALDDRAGCAMVIEVLRRLAESDHPNTVYGVGTTQEEAGLVGAQTSAFAVAPHVAIVAEISVADDVPGKTQDGSYTELGKGVALCIRDSGLIPNRRLREFVAQVADEAGIPVQYVTMERGTTDGTRIQMHGEGVPTLYIGPPARYIHSHASIMDAADFDGAVKLLVEVIRRLDRKTVDSFTQYEP